MELLSGDYVVVDHKSYPGEQPEQKILKSYTGQLQIYREALHSSTGAFPTEVLVHLPLRGDVFAVHLPAAESEGLLVTARRSGISQTDFVA